MRLIVALLLSGFAVEALADSPLTSIDLAPLYGDARAVAHAKEAKLDAKTLGNLRMPEMPFEIRMAIINAIGWDAAGKPELAATYKRFLREQTGSETPRSSVDLFNLGYLMAMGDYHRVDAALALLDQAARLEPRDQAVHMVRALVAAQKAMSGPWCKVFEVVDAVTKGDYDRPIRDQAIKVIMDYIGEYGRECKGKEVAPAR
jgi:hypothetical protein